MKPPFEYEGWFDKGTYTVLRNGGKFDPVPSTEVRRWADVFAFGSRSLEALQLAFAMLLEERLGFAAADMAESFRDDVISKLPTNGERWKLTSADLWRWILS